MQTKQSKTKKPAAPAAARQDSLETPAAFPPDSLMPPPVYRLPGVIYPAPAVLDEATENGIHTVSQDIAETLALRIRTIITAAVKAGAEPADHAAAVRVAGIMLNELMKEAARVTTAGLEQHFSGTAPYADEIMGNYAACL